MTRPSSERTTAPAAVFRVAPAALVAAIFLALCVSPIAFQGGPWFLLFLAPLAIVVLVLRVRTTVDAEGLHVRTLTTTTLPWEQVATLRLPERSFVRAVPVEGTRRGRELTLLNVRIRDLGRVGEASGGRISVPSPAEAAEAEEHRRELEAARLRVQRLREARDAQARAVEAQETEDPQETEDSQDTEDTRDDAGTAADRDPQAVDEPPAR